MDTNWGIIGFLGAFPARRGARTPPPCAAPSPRRSPTASLPHTARLPCGKAGLVCLAYIVGAGSAQRTGGTRARAHRRATRYRTRRRATCRLITARLWLGQYSGLVCPQFFARAVLPRRHRKARAPRQPGDAGSKKRVPVLICLTSQRPEAGDVSLDAQHDAHDEDAGDCRDTGGRRVQRDLPTLSVPRLGPLRIHKVVLLRPRFQGPTQCQARFPVIQHRNRLIPQALAAAIAPFVHWDIRAQTAGIYLLIH